MSYYHLDRTHEDLEQCVVTKYWDSFAFLHWRQCFERACGASCLVWPVCHQGILQLYLWLFPFLSVFSRIPGSPLQDRNQVELSSSFLVSSLSFCVCRSHALIVLVSLLPLSAVFLWKLYTNCIGSSFLLISAACTLETKTLVVLDPDKFSRTADQRSLSALHHRYFIQSSFIVGLSIPPLSSRS